MSKLAPAFVGVVAAWVLSSACNPSTPKLTLKHGEQRGRLEKNGLRFVIMPDQTTQLVEVDVRYEVGAREDPPGKAGLAHLAEHLMYQQRPDGPQTKPLMHFLQQTALNMNAYTNAYTNWDTTHYMTSAHAGQLDALVEVEAMRLHYGCQTITEEEFLREREVVRNEIWCSSRATSTSTRATSSCSTSSTRSARSSCRRWAQQSSGRWTRTKRASSCSSRARPASRATAARR